MGNIHYPLSMIIMKKRKQENPVPIGAWDETSTQTEFNDPVYKLWYSVLEQAVREYKRYKEFLGGRTKIAKSALPPIAKSEAYINSQDFELVCAFIGTNPETIRKSLKEWEEDLERRAD